MSKKLNIELNTTIPKDKSDTIFLWDNNREYKCTKFYALLTSSEIQRIQIAQYIHTKKYWIDREGFQVYDTVLGWFDADDLIRQYEN